ncbi:MAG: DUF2017 family protein [Ilumatobacteraceae bacterium]
MLRRKKPLPPLQRVDGGFSLNLQAEEREMLTRLLDELTELLTGSPEQPLLRRMFPPAYHLPADAEADAEYQRLMREDLVASRLEAITTLGAALRGQELLDEAGLTALMQAINALRLVLGTLLDVDEEHDLDEVADDDPLLGEHHLYGYLSFLLDAAVRASLSPATG